MQAKSHVKIEGRIWLAPLIAEHRADARQSLIERVGVNVQLISCHRVLTTAREIGLKGVR